MRLATYTAWFHVASNSLLMFMLAELRDAVLQVCPCYPRGTVPVCHHALLLRVPHNGTRKLLSHGTTMPVWTRSWFCEERQILYPPEVCTVGSIPSPHRPLFYFRCAREFNQQLQRPRSQEIGSWRKGFHISRLSDTAGNIYFLFCTSLQRSCCNCNCTFF